MCQTLVDKMAQSEQLQAVADPEVLVLFEDWMEELEHEVLSLIQRQGAADPLNLVDELGLSLSGTQFLIAKLKREGKI